MSKVKVQFTAKVINDEGKTVIQAIETETTIPDIRELGDASTFLTVFDRYEQAVLHARNQTAADLTEAYLEAAALEDAAKKGLHPDKAAR